MKGKLCKEILVAVLLISTILSFSPVAYGETTSVQQSVDAIKMEMKKAAMSYVEPALKGELITSTSLDLVLNSTKKNYQATMNVILTSNLSEKEKQAKLKELEALYQEKIVKGLIPYIDAYNYATKYLDPILKEIKEAEAKSDFLAVEKAYHKLSVQLKSRTSILYRFKGKAPRDLLLEKYKKPADAKRNELIIPVTIMMKLTNAQQLYLKGKKQEAMKAMEDVPSLVPKLSSTNTFHRALKKELERLQAIVFPPIVHPVVPTPPVSPPSGGGEDNEKPSERALRIAKTNAITEITNYKVVGEYSSVNWTTILKLKTEGTITINNSTSISAVTDALNSTKGKIDQIKTHLQEETEANAQALNLAKTKAINELTNFKVDVKDNYSTTNWEQIVTLKATGLKAINSAKKTTEVTQALADAKAAILLIEIKSTLSTIREITVTGVVAVVSTSDTNTYSVMLPARTVLANLRATDIKLTATSINAIITPAITNDGGNTWEVTVSSEDGKSTTTYTINLTVTPSAHLTIDDIVLQSATNLYSMTTPPQGFKFLPFSVGFKLGSYNYWVSTDTTNNDIIAITAYNQSGNQVRTWEKTGARYIDKIEIDKSTGKLKFIGQTSYISVPWEEFLY